MERIQLNFRSIQAVPRHVGASLCGARGLDGFENRGHLIDARVFYPSSDTHGIYEGAAEGNAVSRVEGDIGFVACEDSFVVDDEGLATRRVASGLFDFYGIEKSARGGRV